MNSTLARLVPCIAWAALAISSATPADALALSKVGGASYANCSAASEYFSFTNCSIDFQISQRIKMVGDPCNGGNCDNDEGGILVEFVYEPSRKVAQELEECSLYGHLYALDSCSC
jgi:hypothetical protein